MKARAPFADESLDGYLAYRAEMMGLPNIAEFADVVGIEGYGRVRISRFDADLGDLADLLEMPAEALNERTSPAGAERRRRMHQGQSIHVMHLERTRRVFAPEALEQSPHHRQLWDLRPFPFDGKTWELLGHRCPDQTCRRSQGWHHTRGIDRCDECGGPLHGDRGEVVADEHRSALAAAIGLVHPDPERRAACDEQLPSGLTGIDRGELLDLLVALAGVVDPSLRAQHHFWCLRPDAPPRDVTNAVALAWPLLVGWPDAFEDYALDRAMKTARGRGDGNRGATARFLRTAGKTSSVPAGLSRIIGEESRRLAEAGVERGIGAVEAARYPGLRASDISRARRDGRIGVVASMRRGLFIPLLVRSEVEKLSNDFADGLPLTRAAARFGCGCLGIEQLCVMGLLGGDAIDRPITDGEPRVQISALVSLAEQIERRSTALDDEEISLIDGLYAYGGSEKPVGQIVRAILSGTLRVRVDAGTLPILRRVHVGRRDVATIMSMSFDRGSHADRRLLEKVSKVEAGRELNLGGRATATALARWEGADKKPVVPVPWLLETMATCVSSRELAARMKRSGRFANTRLASLGIPEVAPHLYDRELVERSFGGWASAPTS